MLASGTVTVGYVGICVVLPEKVVFSEKKWSLSTETVDGFQVNVVISKNKKSPPFFPSPIIPIDQFGVKAYDYEESSAGWIRSTGRSLEPPGLD